MIASWFEVLLGVLRLEPQAFDPSGVPRPGALMLTIVVLAGVSEALGESVVLFINRVPKRRFGLTLASLALTFVLDYLFWVLSTLLVLTLLLPATPTPTLGTVAGIVALAFTPRLFAFVLLTPLLGPSLNVALSIWTLLALTVGVGEQFALSNGQALTATVVGWLGSQLIRRTIGYPLVRLSRTLAQRAAGRELRWRPEPPDGSGP